MYYIAIYFIYFKFNIKSYYNTWFCFKIKFLKNIMFPEGFVIVSFKSLI